jgi:dipeptidyl aminopeptidase/acylaminoacyl peptidase
VRSSFLIAPLILTALPAFAGSAAPDDLEAAVARMARIGSSRSPSFSPDGKRIVFISDRGGVPQVWMVSTDGGEPKQITRLEDQVGSVDWSPDGKWLAFSLAPGGGLNEQIYLVAPDGGEPRRITEGGQVNNRLAGWSGRYLRFSSNRRDPGALDSYIHDSETGETRLVARNPGVGTLTDVSNDGRRAIVQRVKSRGDGNLFLIDLATGREELLTPHEPPGTFDGGRFSPDGSTVYFTSNKDNDRVGLAKVLLGPDGKPGPVERITSRDDLELDGFEVDEQGTSAALVWNAGGRSELAFLDLSNRQLRPVPNLAGELVGGLEFSADGRLLALTLSGSKLPSDVWVLDRTSGRVRQVTQSPHEGVDLASLVAPELVRFKAHDGLELSGWLYRPAGAKGPGPVVVSFHGGPESQERPAFSATYQALVSRGIGVFAPNVRGSSGFGKKFVNLDNGPLRFNGIKDIKSCVDFLVGQGIADPKRIGIMGGSYGGYMTMAGITEYPDLFAAGANLFGMVNFETFFSHTQPWMAAISTLEYGDPATQKDLLRSLSPLYKLDRVKAPTLVLHGANDTNVPVVEAEQVVDTLKKRGVPVDYVLFPDEGHGFRKTPNRIRSTVAIVRWFERHLQPKS